MTERELAVRSAVMRSFAESGAPPAVDDSDALRALADRHVIVLDDDGRIVMAHPFAAPGADARIESAGRTWWGNCAWDALGIVAALGLRDATIENNGVELPVWGGRVESDALFHVAVPARRWWDDIAFT